MNNFFTAYQRPVFYKSTFSNIWSKLKILVLVLLAFRTMEPYVFWGKGILTIVIILFLIAILFMQVFYDSTPLKFNIHKFYRIVLPWILFFVYKHLFWSTSIIAAFISIFSALIPVVVLLLCSDAEKKDFLHKFTSFIAFILFFSMLEYLLVVFKIVNITPSKIYYPDNDFYKYFDNYKLFIVVFDLRNFLIPRFQSVFTEPGHLGMMGALLLYANQYKLKDKRVLIIFISTLLTMSLASYVLLLAGVFLYKYSTSNKKTLMAIVLTIIAFFLILGGVIYYNAFPESNFSTAIIGRLMPDEKKGIAGNNRTTPAFKKAFAEQMSDIDENSLFGYGSNAIKERIPGTGGNSSGTCFIFMYGIVGGILLSCFYLSILRANYTNASVGMLVLFFLSFLQRPYATWFAQIAIMVCASVNYKTLSDNSEKIKEMEGKKN